MEKNVVLAEVTRLATEGLLDHEELLHAFDAGSRGRVSETRRRHIGITEVLYVIGGSIVLLGVVLLVAQNWDVLNTVTRVVATLGSGIAAYVVGVLFSRETRTDRAGHAFFLLSALLMPTGLAVTFREAGFSVGTAGMQSLMAMLLLAAYGASRLVFRRSLFTLFSVIFGTWLFYSLATWLFQNAASFYDTLRFYEYLTLLAGVSHILLGYAFLRTSDRPLVGFLYGAGLVGFLSSALGLGGWVPNQNVFWEVVFPGLALGAVFLSVVIRSRIFLTFGSLFLMAYIVKITSEYFSGSLGWPFALVIAGLVLMGIGYGTFAVHRRYLSSVEQRAAA